ncbi:MAG: 16S rRNA (adenine(1518)-N(6)/adenine(1519)-N(6))-dimethyltransferase RsmA [Gammaproteobacteria bacterium]|nr:16S rRNA (adenine(1518)-N(6)/adenine(1519)-N(6))-dimethyltransferase RsmA [Gammaproteobacteria bacterium]
MHLPRKRFGQNFLQDQGAISKIVKVIGPRSGDHMIEIGPGRGAITVPLLSCGIELDVIELDRDLIQHLEQLKYPGNSTLSIHNSDALDADICAMARNGRKLRVVGNLPYNISTPLLFRLIDQLGCIQDMHLMLQKEVVDRMAADPGNRQYGRLSVMVQYHCEVQQLFTIGPGAFIPQPKVDSSFVRLIPHAEPRVKVADYDAFSLLVKTAFAYRRKTLRNALKGLVTDDAFDAAAVDPNLRAEQLHVEELARLSEKLTPARSG